MIQGHILGGFGGPGPWVTKGAPKKGKGKKRERKKKKGREKKKKGGKKGNLDREVNQHDERGTPIFVEIGSQSLCGCLSGKKNAPIRVN